MRSEGFDVIILDAGNLFFKKETLEPGTPSEIFKATAEIIVSGFNEIGCHAFSPGSKDFAGGLAFVQKMQEMANFPFGWFCKIIPILVFRDFCLFKLKRNFWW